jgi:hypothetical protein
MIKTRIASAAAVFTFGLAALGGTVVAVAAPAYAAPSSSDSSSSSGSTPSSGTTSASGTTSTSASEGGMHFHLTMPNTPMQITPGG